MTGPVKERPLHLGQADDAQINALVARAREGDRGSFDSLVEFYTPQIYNLALRIVGSRDDAEDCVQEAFVRAFCALRSFRGEAAFSTWLYRVALNVATDAARKRSRSPLPISGLAPDGSEPGPPDLERLAAHGRAEASEPEGVLFAEQRRQIILKAICRLPEHQRAVVVLYDFQGLSYEEIARITQTRVGTVKSRLNRARLALKDLLAADLELLQG
jgi:RNA polymerase sigma-70 factor (ECF subfamily)